MSGKLIFVSGLTGAGKTTLVEAALSRIDNLEVLLTYTTRPKRIDEDSSYEYMFVDDIEYDLAKTRSNNWDETKYSGYKYASDAEKFINDLNHGINVIVSVTPNMDDIRAMANIYKHEPVTVWINTDVNIAHNRVAGDLNRSKRIEDESVKNEFNIIFQPNGILQEDVQSFTKLIRDIIS